MTDASAPRTIDLMVAEPSARTAGLRSLALWLAGWTAFVMLMATILNAQKGVPFRYALESAAVNYYALALCSVGVWYGSARLAARGSGLAAQTAVQIVMGAVLVTLWQGAYAFYLWLEMGPGVWTKVYGSSLLFQMLNAVILYGCVVGGTLAVQSARRERLHERRQHELALAAREAELRALNAQLEPHFLLNTLNSVLALVDTSPREARVMIERLSELLKAAFDEMEEPEVPLGRELDLLEAYLGIEQVRFGDRLRVTIDVPEAVRETPVPPFLLQPIVENAIKHAVAPIAGPAFITVSARHIEGRVRILVVDSGRGFDYQAGARRGRGLQLAERRLQAHAPSGQLSVERSAAGFCVVLTLPA